MLVSSITDPADGQFCGGVLIKPDWVVTAGHCVFDPDRQEVMEPKDVSVFSGTDDLQGTGKRSNLDIILVHKQYDPFTQDFDIALLQLHDTATGKPIRPVTAGEESAVVKWGETAFVTGWGDTESGSPSPQLKIVGVPLQSHDKCSAIYDGAKTPRMICAGTGGGDSCGGDSGGPLTRMETLIGVVSWGPDCLKSIKLPVKPGVVAYGVYSRIAAFSDWIAACVRDPSTCPSR